MMYPLAYLRVSGFSIKGVIYRKNRKLMSFLCHECNLLQKIKENIWNILYRDEYQYQKKYN